MFKIGDRVVCVYKSYYFGRVGTVSIIGPNNNYFVIDDNKKYIGGDAPHLDHPDWYGWLNESSFRRIPNNTRNLLYEETSSEGLELIYIWPDDRFGSIGTITTHHPVHGISSRGSFFVWRESDIDYLSDACWDLLERFQVLLPEENSEDRITLPSSLQIQEEKKPCPLHYYGIDDCTCGKATQYKFSFN